MTPDALTALRARFAARAHVLMEQSRGGGLVLESYICGRNDTDVRWSLDDNYETHGTWEDWTALAEAILGVTRAEVEALADHAEHLERYVDSLEREADAARGSEG